MLRPFALAHSRKTASAAETPTVAGGNGKPHGDGSERQLKIDRRDIE
jgi:hypothetical protein